MNIELTKTQRLLLCGGLIGLASLMLQACETVMKENEDIREKICGNWQSAEAGPDVLVYKEGEHYKVTLFRRSGVRRRLKPETYLLQREENGNLYMNTGFRIDVAYNEETEKMEVRELAEKLGGDMEAAIRQIAERRKEEKQ